MQGQEEEWGADRAFCADLEGEGGGHLGERLGSSFSGESSHFLEHWSCGGGGLKLEVTRGLGCLARGGHRLQLPVVSGANVR